MEVPSQFSKKSFLWLSVLFEAVFSIIFLILYSPFGSPFWFGFNNLSQGTWTVVFFLLAYGYLFLSRTLMYYAQKRFSLRLTSIVFVIWFLVDILSVSFIYMAQTNIIGQRPSYLTLSEELIRTYGYVGLVRFIPFLLTFERALALDYRDLSRKKAEDILATEASIIEGQMVNLYDHAGSLKVTAAQKDIYYLESQDNYVCLHYMVEGKMTEYLLRCSTSEVEGSFTNTSIVRCHRSYLVNLNHIKLLRHERGRATIVLSSGNADVEIPVSKSYYSSIVDLIMPDKVVNK